MCESTDEKVDSAAQSNMPFTEKTAKLIYFTDPICSSCWGIEPQLRNLNWNMAILLR